MSRFLSSPYFCAPALVVLSAVGFLLFFYQPIQADLLDFSIYHEAGRRLSEGQNIYTHLYRQKAHDGQEFELVYLYPPYLAASFAIISGLDKDVVKVLWCTLSFLAVVGVICFLTSIFRSESPYRLGVLPALTLLSALVVCFEPVYWGVMMGQVDAIVFFWICAYLFAILKGRYQLGGVFLSFAAVLKISPALLCIWFVLARKWKGFGAFLLSVLVLTCIEVFLFGVQPFHDFFTSFSSISNGNALEGFVFNYSSVSSVLALLPFRQFNTILSFVLKCVFWLVFLFFLWRDREYSSRSSGFPILGVNSIILCFMLLLSPILWFHHFIWALVPLVTLMCKRIEGEENRFRYWTICAAFVFAITQINLLHYQVLMNIPWAVSLSGVVPTLILFALVFMLSNMSGQEQASQ